MPLDPLTIVFALVAIVVVWKLRSVLGERTGLEKHREGFFGRRTGPNDTPGTAAPGRAFPRPSLVRLPTPPVAALEADRWRGVAEPGSALAAGLDAIAAADSSFAPGPFLDGAKTAYEAIVTAFAAGERKTLQNLLARDVYDGFNGAILAREKRGETLVTTFVSMDDARFEVAGMDGRTARATVRFLSKQISATRDKDGQLIEGSPDRAVDMNDIWTFAREVTSRDPNWKLIATESGH